MQVILKTKYLHTYWFSIRTWTCFERLWSSPRGIYCVF